MSVRDAMRRRPLEFYLGLWTLILVAAAGAVMIAGDWFSKPSVKPLVLKAVDENERIRVDWDATHPQVQVAESAVLEVQDGQAFQRYPVEKRVLLSGGLDYLRKSADVFLTLTLLQGGRPSERATVRTIAAIPSELAPPRPSPPSETRSRGR